MIKKDKDEKEDKVEAGAATSSEEEVSFRIDFPRLFTTLSSTLSTDESTLLLYLLLHQNAEFRSHVLASSDVEKVSARIVTSSGSVFVPYMIASRDVARGFRCIKYSKF